MKHIENTVLEKLYLNPDELSAQQKETISLHLKECASCREHSAKLKDFYQQLQNNLESQPTEHDKAFADKLLARQRLALPEKKLALQERVDNALSTFVEIIEPYQRPFAQRIVRYIKIHPLRVASGFSMAAALVFATLLIRPMFKDKNPDYARAKDEFLIVYNKSGEELWKKHVGLDYDQEIIQKNMPDFAPEDYLTTFDVDNDGKKEIISTLGMFGPIVSSNTMFCYNPDGKLRWQYPFSRTMKFGNQTFADNYLLQKIIIGDFRKTGKPIVIATVVHFPYYPSAIIALDASTGNLLGEYWTPGTIKGLYHLEIDGDSTEEIIVAGQNNGYDMASLSVLDPNLILGYSPSTPDYRPSNLSLGKEKYYILIPRSDLKELTNTAKRNIGRTFHSNDNHEFVIHVAEQVNNYWYILLYHFNSKMECIGVDGEDMFVEFHKKMEKEGKLTKKLDAQYYEDLRKSILYWDGEKFVNYPTMNKLYLTKIAEK